MRDITPLELRHTCIIRLVIVRMIYRTFITLIYEANCTNSFLVRLVNDKGKTFINELSGLEAHTITLTMCHVWSVDIFILEL